MPDTTLGAVGPEGVPSTRFEVEMAAHEGALDHAQDLVEKLFGEHPDLSARDRFRFETAVVEVLANIVEHAFTGDEVAGLRRLRLTLTVTPTELTALLADNGEPAGVDLSAVIMPGEDAESGRGLALALAAVDDLQYRHVGGRNYWDLRCHRGA
ncbi:ATP-binding protein [Nocardioides sp. AX2bis]|uniref:ATP-binding protein n=1 Tax=Nocardioides sp. AX2bis TaxID=2653157 RepID=UPI0012F31EE1|nr:ATP-binding protein [Nocardioides sp. AX2bis]VXB48040.1 Serine/threonine-protein kinase RsbW [Nocardioides sp. AX2bis]